jgi:hypothetical protein
MNSKLAKLALTAAFGLAITFTFTACEEKKKQDGTTTTETAAEADAKKAAEEAAVAAIAAEEAKKAAAEEAAAVAIAAEEAAAEAARVKAEAEAAEKAIKAAAKKAGCGKGGGGVKLIECIITSHGYVQKFVYDEQNRIVKISTSDTNTITYTDNLVTVGTQKFVIDGNKVTYDYGSFTIDKDGYYIFDNSEHLPYEYKDGNLIKVSWNSSGGASYYSYDSKKSPFSNSKTPKWLIQRLVREYSVSKNNIIEINNDGEVTGGCNCEYKYDSDGFPVTKTEKCYSEGEEDTEMSSYTYYGGK